MAEKGKGKDAGKLKKPKNQKVGNRPHELREREGLVNQSPTKNPVSDEWSGPRHQRP